jgi:DNA-binding transcriptional MerR regulator
MNMTKKLIPVHLVDARRACKLSLLSRTMLDYLTREGFVVPSGSTDRRRGKPRLYTFGDIVTLRIIARLLASGIEIRRLRKSLRLLRQQMAGAPPGGLPFRFLVTNGKEVFFENAGNVESLTHGGQLAFAFLIDLKKYEAEVMNSSRGAWGGVGKAYEAQRR